MKVNNIDDLIKLDLVIEQQEYKGTFHNKYVLYAVNIFLNKCKNKYKNTKPIPCIIKKGGRFVDDDGHYCLITIEQDIWSDYFRYNHLDRIDEILINGEVQDRGGRFVHKFPDLLIFTTKKEAYEYIDKYKRIHDVEKHKEKLSRINKDIEILINEKQRLEKLIASYEGNN